MATRTDVLNLSEQAHYRIRSDILTGALLPEEKLQIDAISLRYSIGAVPVREALNRLSTEGLVQRRSNRGFYVAPISQDNLSELVQTRIWLETLALRQSIENIDDALEDALVVSFHRLVKTQRQLPQGKENNLSEEWERRHKAFHLLLLGRCGSSLLLEFCSNLMDEAVRYRNLSMNSNPSKLRREGAAAEHEAILAAVLEHDADRACQLLEDHYRVTLDGLKNLIERRPVA